MLNGKSFFSLLFISLLVLCTSAQAESDAKPKSTAKYSNVIFFGDSLTDIGNMPESVDYAGDSSLSGIFFNLYVPIANPVLPDSMSKEIRDEILPGLDYVTYFPPLRDEDTGFALNLPKQPAIYDNGKIQTDTRDYRSLNWSEYFAYNATFTKVNNNKTEVLLPQDTHLTPWVMLHGKKTCQKTPVSVNYAFSSAVATGYSDCSSNPFPISPSIKDVFKQQKKYRDGQTGNVDHDLVLRDGAPGGYGVVIPGVDKQIDLFSSDLQHGGKVQITNRTAYVIYIGANDIGKDFYAYVADPNPKNFAILIHQLTKTIPDKVIDNTKKLIDTVVASHKGIHPGVILVSGQSNLALTPGVLQAIIPDNDPLKRHLVARILSQLTIIYNSSLKQKIRTTEYLDWDKVHYVDLQTPITEIANKIGDGYRRSVGEACESKLLSSASEGLLTGGAASCYKKCGDVANGSILFWNDSHGSQQYNQIIANAMLGALSHPSSLNAGDNSTATPVDLQQLQLELEQLLTNVSLTTDSPKEVK